MNNGVGNPKRLHLRMAGTVFSPLRPAIGITMVLLVATIIGWPMSPPVLTPTPVAKPQLASILAPSLAPSSAPESALMATPRLVPSPISQSAPVATQTQNRGLTATPAPARIRPIDKGFSNIYIGCIHSAHTDCSDGELLYPSQFYSTFKPYWDWIATTDHDIYLDDAEWQDVIENYDAYNGKDFVSLFGYEWTSSCWGHLSVVFGGNHPSKTSGRARSSDLDYNNPRKLYAYLDTAGGLAVFAHPALSGLSIDFSRESDYRNDTVACLVGIFGINNTIHWNATWDYADGSTIDVPGADNAYSGGWIKTALDCGYRLGFVGELDLHKNAIDPMSYRYTGVVADSLTTEGIFEALKGRHTYAVMSPSGLGKRILLRADAGDHLMGDIFANESNMINVTLQGKTDLAQFTLVNLFVNGKIAQSRVVSGRDLIEDFSIKLDEGNNYTFFEVRALSADGQLSQAITSPMYVSVSRAQDQNWQYQ